MANLRHLFSVRMSRRLLIALLLATAVFWVQPATSVYAGILTVTTTIDELASPGTGCSLREAIMEANAAVPGTYPECGVATGGGADTINLPAGTYRLTITSTIENNNLDGDLDIASDVTILGAGAATTIISQESTQVDRPFHFLSGTIEISGVTMTNNGGLTDAGGAIYLLGGTATIRDSIITNSWSDYGGAIFNNGATITIIDSTVSNNYGFALSGAIDNQGTLNIINSTVSGNWSDGNCGSIFSNGMLTITNSTISNNQTFSNYGGGIFSSGTAIIENSTIADNTAATDGDNIVSSGGTITLTNSIVAGQGVVSNCYYFGAGGTITSNGYNIESGTDCGFASVGDQQNVSNANLNLGPLANNGGPTQTRLPGAGSFALDQIPPALCLAAADQRGVNRPQGTNCDVGAVEVEVFIPLVAAAACNGNNLEVDITAGDNPFDITGTSGPNLPQNGVGTGITTVAGPGSWTGLTVTETAGDTEAINLGDFTCPAGAVGLVATATCSGADLNISIAAGDPNFNINANDPIAAPLAQNNVSLGGPYTLTSTGGYGTWTNITVDELSGDTETVNLPNVTCSPPAPGGGSGGGGGAAQVQASGCNVTIDVEADRGVVNWGDQVVWTVLVTNPGPDDCQGVQTYGTMPGEFAITDITTTRGSINWDGGQYYLVELGTLAVSDQVTVTLDSLLQGGAAFNLPEGAAAQSAGQQICLTGYITDPVNDTDCVMLFPDILPSTGGEPVSQPRNWGWVVAAGMLITGLGGAYLTTRRRKLL